MYFPDNVWHYLLSQIRRIIYYVKPYLSIDMIRPGDGSDLSNRLDGDAGPATSGDEVLVSAMLSPVRKQKEENNQNQNALNTRVAYIAYSPTTVKRVV